MSISPSLTKWQKWIRDFECLARIVFITLFSHHDVRFTFFRSSFRYFFLTSSKQLFRFRISSEQKQLLMFLKKEMMKKPLFRRCKNIVKFLQIFDEQVLIDSTFRSQMINLESITDMKLSIDSYIFRRDNEQAFDNSNK